jgi:hypothetical protein
VPFTHRNIKDDVEDIGSVFDGPGGRMKEWDAVRVPPGTWRGYEAGPDGLGLLVVGSPNLGEDPRSDVDGERSWWAD